MVRFERSGSVHIYEMGSNSLSHLESLAADIAGRARSASRSVAAATEETRTKALLSIAKHLRQDTQHILRANEKDLEQASDLSDAMKDRLRLTAEKIEGIAKSVEEVSAFQPLVGKVESVETRPNGLEVSRVRIPLGVVFMIYESRPNVTIDAAVLCIKSGNAVILRGGREAAHSNQAFAGCVSKGLQDAGISVDGVIVVQETDRQLVTELLMRDEEIDVVIPRGGEGLIRSVAESAKMPVLRHYKGVCHLFVHQTAKPEMAVSLAVNGKAQRPGVCNATETILVDSAVADKLVPLLCQGLWEQGVEIRGDEDVVRIGGAQVVPAQDDDWGTEYLALVVSMRIVDGLEGAVEHIYQYGSQHTEAIVTEDDNVAQEFLRRVDSSTVLVNASTRFADGGELGLGAEIGISTTKLHAYGPMGAEGLTTLRFSVKGTGQIRT